jgi:hypothetical protein
MFFCRRPEIEAAVRAGHTDGSRVGVEIRSTVNERGTLTVYRWRCRRTNLDWTNVQI